MCRIVKNRRNPLALFERTSGNFSLSWPSPKFLVPSMNAGLYRVTTSTGLQENGSTTLLIRLNDFIFPLDYQRGFVFTNMKDRGLIRIRPIMAVYKWTIVFKTRMVKIFSGKKGRRIIGLPWNKFG